MDSISISELQSVDQIQNLIDKLQAQMAKLKTTTEGGSNGEEGEGEEVEERNGNLGGGGGGLLDKSHQQEEDGVEELIDPDKMLEEDSDDTQWLVKTDGKTGTTVEELERQCKSSMALHLLNVQTSLLNMIKRAIFEEKTRHILDQSQSHSSALLLSRVTSTNQTPTPPPRRMSHPKKKMSVDSLDLDDDDFDVNGVGVRPPLEGSFDLGDRDLPVLASSPLPSRFAKTKITAGGGGSFNESPVDIDLDNLSNSSFYVQTPPKNIDSRTYTRPKKSRLSLDPQTTLIRMMPHNENHIRARDYDALTISKGKAFSMQGLHIMEDSNLNANLNRNETFVQEDTRNSTFHGDEYGDGGDDGVMMNTTVTLEPTNTTKPVVNCAARLRQLGRKETFIASKSSESVYRDLNSTFTKGENGSPAGNDNNVRSLSIEEIHKKARQQEQTLRSAIPKRTIARKGTFTYS